MDALVKASWLRALRSNEYRLCKDVIAMNNPLSFDPYGVLIDLYFKNNSGDHGWIKADSLGILNDILGDKDRLYPLMSKDELPYTGHAVPEKVAKWACFETEGVQDFNTHFENEVFVHTLEVSFEVQIDLHKVLGRVPLSVGDFRALVAMQADRNYPRSVPLSVVYDTIWTTGPEIIAKIIEAGA